MNNFVHVSVFHGGMCVHISGTIYFFWDRVFHWSRDDQVAKLARVSPRYLFVHASFPVLGLQMYVRGWSSGPLSHKVNILLNQSSSQPNIFIFDRANTYKQNLNRIDKARELLFFSKYDMQCFPTNNLM